MSLLTSVATKQLRATLRLMTQGVINQHQRRHRLPRPSRPQWIPPPGPAAGPGRLAPRGLGSPRSCGFGAFRFGLLRIGILFDAEVVNDESLAVRRVLAHEEGQHVVQLVLAPEIDGVEADVLANEVGEFVRADLAQTFEARDFRLRSQRGNGVDPLLLRVAIARLLLTFQSLQLIWIFY